MLTLARRNLRSIYSLSAKGAKWGYMGCGPTHGSTQAPDVRESLVVRRLARVRMSGACQTSVDSARVVFGRTSVRGRTSGASVVRGAWEVRSFGSGVEVSVVRKGRTSGAWRLSDIRGSSVVRSLGTSSSSSSCPMNLASSRSCPLNVLGLWPSSKHVITHRVST